MAFRKINYPAANRNKDVILAELKKYINHDMPCKLLEISSGSGQHIAHIAAAFPKMMCQPSEYDDHTFGSLSAYAADAPHHNICQPIKIDIGEPLDKWHHDLQRPQPYFNGKEHTQLAQLAHTIDYMLNINMIHITPFNCTIGLFQNASLLLKHMGILFTYGPYAENGVLVPQSNIDFDQHLKQINPLYGVRDVAVLRECADKYKLRLINSINMPSNNKILVWEKY